MTDNSLFSGATAEQTEENLSVQELDIIHQASRELLTHWCIVREYDERSKVLYNCIVNPKYQNYLSETFERLGLGLEIINLRGQQVAYLRSSDEEIAGEKLLKTPAIIVLCLDQIYLQKQRKASLSEAVTMEVGELVDLVNTHMKCRQLEAKDIKPILYRLAEFRLIKIREKKKKDFCRTSLIELLPSLQAFLPEDTLASIDERLEEYSREAKKGAAEEQDDDSGEEDLDDDSD